MPSIELDQGSIHYEEAGPADGRPVVFVHGFLMAGDVWASTVERLAPRGLRCLAPTWPMGAHAAPLGVDLTAPAMARLIADFLAALDLRDVVLVGNDSGGAMSQIVAAHHGVRLGTLVLTNCDTLENFPPTLFKPLVKAAASKTALKALLVPMKAAAARKSPLAYGLLTYADIDHMAQRWVAPALADDRMIDDIRSFLSGMEKSVTIAAAERLKTWDRPIHLIWGADDKLFTVGQAKTFANTVPVASLNVVEHARTLPMIDEPGRIAELIADAAAVPAAA